VSRASAFFVAVLVLLAGCGGSSSSSTSSTASAPALTSGSGVAGQVGSGVGSTSSSPASSGSAASTAPKPAHLPSGTVARVDGTPITAAAYSHWLEVSAPATIKPLIANASDFSACIAAAKSGEERIEKLIEAKGSGSGSGSFAQGGRKPKTEAQRKEQCEERYKAAKLGAVRTLIRRVQIQSQAKELGTSVSEGEVAKQAKSQEASQKAIEKTSAAAREFSIIGEGPQSGAGLEEVVRSRLLELAIRTKVREKLTKAGAISQGQIEKYFNEHRRVLGKPERRSYLLATTTSKSVAEAVAKEHGSGGLKVAAGNHTITPTPGTYQCQIAGLPPASPTSLYGAICSAKRGVISGPVSEHAQYNLFEVKSIVPATKPSFAQAKAEIKELLIGRGEEGAASKVREYEQQVITKQKARTECSAGYIVELCKEYVAPGKAK
jgi:PPIC-type PPIASE domain